MEQNRDKKSNDRDTENQLHNIQIRVGQTHSLRISAKYQNRRRNRKDRISDHARFANRFAVYLTEEMTIRRVAFCHLIDHLAEKKNKQKQLTDRRDPLSRCKQQ